MSFRPDHAVGPAARPALRGAAWAAAYGLLAVFFCWPVLSDPSRLGIGDWDYFFHQQAVALQSLFGYHQLPFWNAWACGGNVLWQNPQLALLNPVYVLAPLVSLPVAIKLNILLHYVAGLAGMHFLCTRAFRLDAAAVIVFASCLAACSGGIALHLAEGHASFLPYFFLPAQLYFYLDAFQTGRLRSLAAAAALVALGILNGGIYIAALSAVSFTMFAVALAVTSRSWRPLVLLGLLGVFAALFAAPKLVPSIALLRDPSFADVRDSFAPTPFSPALLARALLDPFLAHGAVVPGLAFGWHEYGNHLGAFGVTLIVGGCAWVLAERPWDPSNAVGVSLAVTALALFGLLLGEVGPYAPAGILRRLPFFEGLRLASRFTLVFTLFAASLVAWAMGRALLHAQPSAPARRLLTTVFVAATLLLLAQNRAFLAAAFPLPAPRAALVRRYPPIAPGANDVATDPRGPDSPMYQLFLRQQAAWNCYEPLQLKRVADPGLPPVFAEGGAKVHHLAVTPNRLAFAVTSSDAGGRVYLNQNFVTGWSSSAGALQIDPQNGRAFVTVDAERPGEYEFRFVPPGLRPGLVLSIAGVALAFILRKRTLR